MSDPESGVKPSDAGASGAGSKPGDSSSRRAKRRRKRAQASAIRPPEAVETRKSVGETPDPVAPGKAPDRKKKRRKRSRGASACTPPRAQAETSAAAVKNSQDKPASTKKSGRHRRRLQARPLPQETSPRAHGKPSTDRAETASRADLPRPKPAAPEFPPPDTLYAALDLGTNNCRLLIAQPTRPGQFRVVDAFSRIVRLGEGLGATGRLSEDAMDRAAEALKVCASKLAARKVRRMRLIATEACRAASNGETFLERVARETGLELEVINRETEARLAVSGCASLVGRDARSAVLFDIGGGSSEIAILQISGQRSPRLANHITHWTSLPVGVVTLSERHGGRHVTPDIFAAMVAEVEDMLSRFSAPLASELNGADSGFHMIGTSGTVTTLAGVYLNLPRYDRRQVDGLWMDAADVTAMQDRLVGLDFAGRAANPCIGPDRADLVLAGCAILEAIRRRFPVERMRVADRGLREGLLTEMMADDGAWRRARPRPPFHRI
ncbi:exopolyphosphatase/guanosine-5'-triphosphate,3'-diphosphate pyrophosphatase [Rhizobium sp. SG_E_25_P2]|uniref:Ppx/GppA phosphatase family protein n=1 Tax=Rhizobium sp. SG_E_25_P2 TaxID=2879942 RepID=UPI0024746D41|nr:exopolyphosphatase [Rhizobium sp. SG_E_25_P2]MDH6265653.1 exopolyphosphatase/guanosine-5'-triphosphate,3'-diphosphate pyrophosphatase [Rhizobium sp. SG_E_25_P2]